MDECQGRKDDKRKKKVVKRTAKVKKVTRVTELIKLFKKEVAGFKKHPYYSFHQNSKLNEKLKNLKPKELLFRIDFAQNYVAKYAKEVQSVHFGDSKRQLSLHTGVRYSNYEGQPQTACFTTVSNNLDHQSHAIWAHLEPILKRSAIQYPNVEAIHFFRILCPVNIETAITYIYLKPSFQLFSLS